MALLRCDFFSDSLSLSTSMTVILPQQTTSQIGMSGAATAAPPPVLYLLHGLSDDDTTWTRRTSIERFVAPLGLAVVMPQVHRSFYTDEAYGGRYWSFLTAELPELVQSFFRLSSRREDTFVAGLSMGGYGAFKWAMRQPERFAAAASLSGALDVSRLRSELAQPDDPAMFDRILGDQPVDGSANDLFWLLGQANPSALPALHLSCGTQDELFADNQAFASACDARGVELTTAYPAGGHTWDVWDAGIQDVLARLPLQR